MLLNSVYQAQMHTLLAIGFGVKLCFVFDESNEREHLVDFIWGIKTFKVMSEQTECTE